MKATKHHTKTKRSKASTVVKIYILADGQRRLILIETSFTNRTIILLAKILGI